MCRVGDRYRPPGILADSLQKRLAKPHQQAGHARAAVHRSCGGGSRVTFDQDLVEVTVFDQRLDACWGSPVGVVIGLRGAVEAENAPLAARSSR